MGAVCTCAEDANDRVNDKLTQAERANIAGDKIKKDEWTGELFNLTAFEKGVSTPNILFKDPKGLHPVFLSNCRVIQQDPKIKDLVPAVDNGCVVLGKNLKIELEMHLVQQLFLEDADNVALRIRLEIDEPSKNSEAVNAASLKVVSLTNRNHQLAVPEYVVTKSAKAIDIGLECMQLAVYKRDSHMGKANLQIIYDDEKGEGVPLRIKRIVVSTERALGLPTGDQIVNLCSLNMVGVDWQCTRAAEEDGLPKAFKDQASIETPVLQAGISDSNDKPGFYCYGNKGDDICVDISFLVESETLSYLQLCSRKFLVVVEVKGEGGSVSLSVNGKQQIFDGDRREAKVSDESQKLTLELEYKQLSRNNILQVFATQGCEYICLGQVKLAIA